MLFLARRTKSPEHSARKSKPSLNGPKHFKALAEKLVVWTCLHNDGFLAVDDLLALYRLFWIAWRSVQRAVRGSARCIHTRRVTLSSQRDTLTSSAFCLTFSARGRKQCRCFADLSISTFDKVSSTRMNIHNRPLGLQQFRQPQLAV